MGLTYTSKINSKPFDKFLIQKKELKNSEIKTNNINPWDFGNLSSGQLKPETKFKRATSRCRFAKWNREVEIQSGGDPEFSWDEKWQTTLQAIRPLSSKFSRAIISSTHRFRNPTKTKRK